MSDDSSQAATANATGCLLCGSDATQMLEHIEAGVLAKAYRDQLGITVELPAGGVDYRLCKHCDLRLFAPPVTGSQDFYAQLQKIPWYYSAAKQEFGIAARWIDVADHVLEIGAGRGLFVREIRAASYVGLEFSADAIHWAAQDGTRLLPQTVEQHAADHGGQYDVVCTFQVLEHVAEPRSFLKAAGQCLRPGGHLIVSVPAEDSFAQYAYQDVLNMPPHHVTRWSDRALQSIGNVCSLKLVAVVPEPLGRNMRRAYASAHADRLVSRLAGVERRLLNSSAQRPALRRIAAMLAALIRGYTSVTRWKQRRGHAVVAMFQKVDSP